MCKCKTEDNWCDICIEYYQMLQEERYKEYLARQLEIIDHNECTH